MKMLNQTGLSIDLWGILLVTALQLDFVLLITILLAWQVSQFSVYLLPTYLVHQFVNKDVTEDSSKSPNKAEIDSR